MISIVGIIIVNLLINFQLLKSVIRPIVELSSCVRFYTEHDFSKTIPVYRKNDELLELVKNIDIMRTELSNSISSLEAKVNYDELTGLYNRRYFNEFFMKEWESAMENAKNVSLILFDIDHYKDFNDTYGHIAGDECLKILSQCIQSYNNNPLNCAARYGGEEFSILLLQQTEQEAVVIAEEIRNAILDLRIPHKASPIHEYVTVSLGVASVIPMSEMNPNDLISMADEALYASKQTGRNRVTQYTKQYSY